MTRKAIPLDALRCCRGVFWQNSFLRPDIPVSTGLITAKSLSTPRCPGIDGAYYGKILIYAPISRYRRGLLRQNSFLCPDVPVSTGLIPAKFLSAPRYPASDGAYYGKILICAPMYKGGGYNRPGLVLTYPRPRRPVGIIDLILSHIPAFACSAGYR